MVPLFARYNFFPTRKGKNHRPHRPAAGFFPQTLDFPQGNTIAQPSPSIAQGYRPASPKSGDTCYHCPACAPGLVPCFKAGMATVPYRTIRFTHAGPQGKRQPITNALLGCLNPNAACGFMYHTGYADRLRLPWFRMSGGQWVRLQPATTLAVYAAARHAPYKIAVPVYTTRLPSAAWIRSAALRCASGLTFE